MVSRCGNPKHAESPEPTASGERGSRLAPVDGGRRAMTSLLAGSQAHTPVRRRQPGPVTVRGSASARAGRPDPAPGHHPSSSRTTTTGTTPPRQPSRRQFRASTEPGTGQSPWPALWSSHFPGSITTLRRTSQLCLDGKDGATVARRLPSTRLLHSGGSLVHGGGSNRDQPRKSIWRGSGSCRSGHEGQGRGSSEPRSSCVGDSWLHPASGAWADGP
jgi:hypothetical protein